MVHWVFKPQPFHDRSGISSCALTSEGAPQLVPWSQLPSAYLQGEEGILKWAEDERVCKDTRGHGDREWSTGVVLLVRREQELHMGLPCSSEGLPPTQDAAPCVWLSLLQVLPRGIVSAGTRPPRPPGIQGRSPARGDLGQFCYGGWVNRLSSSCFGTSMPLRTTRGV